MATTDTPDTLAAALARFQANLPTIHKAETAQVRSDKGSYTYQYADLADVAAAVLPKLAEQGLAFTSYTLYSDGDLMLRADLMHTSGDAVQGSYPLPSRGKPQELGSAITYGRRYLLCAMTGVAPDSDDDGQAAQAAHPQPQQRPEAMTQQQSDQMGAALAEAGMSDKDEIRAFASKVAGRQVQSAGELTQDEASRVIARLREIAAETAAGGGQ